MNQEDSEVLFMLGLMYSYGVGCELDDPKVQRILMRDLYNCFIGINFHVGCS